MRITAIFEIRLKAGALDAAAAVIEGAVQETRAFPGCESVDVLQARDEPERLIVIEQWASADDDAAYRRWRATDGAITGLPALLAAPPQLSVAAPWAKLARPS
jgi:quinol monooxygenase YgiN